MDDNFTEMKFNICGIITESQKFHYKYWKACCKNKPLQLSPLIDGEIFGLINLHRLLLYFWLSLLVPSTLWDLHLSFFLH